MVNRDEVPPARCDLGHGALAERHFSITRTARKPNPHCNRERAFWLGGAHDLHLELEARPLLPVLIQEGFVACGGRVDVAVRH